MTVQNDLRLENIKLENFRCFSFCDLQLHEKLTVLVAENGRGKTALLDAIGVALGAVVEAVSSVPSMRLVLSDTRMTWDEEKKEMKPHLPTGFTAQGVIAGEPVTWKSVSNRYSKNSRTSTKDLKVLKRAAGQYKGQSLDAVKALPLVAFYGTGRLWSQLRLTSGKRKRVTLSDSRYSGYIDCLSSSSSYKAMVSWYESKWNAIQDPRFATQQRENIALLRGVEEAVKVVLTSTGWGGLSWYKGHLLLESEQKEQFPLYALSDGIRNMTALAADVARRCATLNPQFGEDAAKKTPGILLIDEIDMHLHPRWQQQVVGLLQEAFPSLQIILSTHSPQVLSSVGNESIRVVSVQDSNGVVETPYSQTRGVKSADLLALIMDVDPIPQVPEASNLSKYTAFIEDGQADTQEAKNLRLKLINHFGEGHPVMIDCDRLIRFQEFKLKKKEVDQ